MKVSFQNESGEEADPGYFFNQVTTDKGDETGQTTMFN